MEFDQVIMEKCEEDTTSSVPFDLDDQVDDEIDEPEYTEIDPEIEEVVPELESPPPPVVTNNQPTCTILSTLKTKEHPTMGACEEQVITLEDDEEDGGNNDVDKTMLDSNNVDSSANNGDSIVNEAIDCDQEQDTENTQTNTVENEENMSVEVVPETMMEVEEEEENVEQTENNIEMEDKSPVDLDDNKKSEPDTEAVSEDELPTEVAAKEPDTEAVSDEELPSAVPADLGETESVSEDELPPDSEKKRKNQAKIKKPSTPSKVDGSTKRKLNADGEYDENSPISETNDETPAKKQALSSDVDDGDDKQNTVEPPPSPKKKVLPELEKYWKAVNEDPSDFTGWTYLLQYVDQENDPEAARDAYNKFLQRYPYCYGYWRKYADYEKKKGNPENVQTVFDQGLKAISLSVDLWLHYINHCKVVHDKDDDKLREQYERAIDACGLEFRSDRLWESYIKWELEGKRLSRVTALYDRLLSTPTFGYMTHFQTFQEFVSTNSPNKILTTDDFLELRGEVKALLKSDEATTAVAAKSSSPTPPPPSITTGKEDEEEKEEAAEKKIKEKEEQTNDLPPGEEPLTSDDTPPTDEETRAIREKIISHRRKMHKANVTDVAARWTYEEGIKRPYFHVKPLERCQLKNWKEYLDFEIEQKDESRIIILFERCLIACALYDEFWLRFVRYLETLDNDNIDKIRDVYTRACKVHHPKKPNLHLQWATFEEGLVDFDKAAEILENIDTVMPNMLQVAYRRINLERRRGDLERACTLYENYITNSKNRTIANNIAVKYARFLCKFKNNIDMAVDVLIKATDKDKDNPRLYLQLIDLGLQRNPVNTDEVISYMDMFIDRENADVEQRVLFAQRKVEFLEDFSEDIKQVLKAHEQFQKCIKQAKERKKAKNEETKVELSPSSRKTSRANEVSTAVPPPPTATASTTNYQYSGTTPANYQSQQFQSGQYANQSGYQQGYQQYPPPSDPNYANYQNWQYSQSAPQAYGPYNQWGSYNYY
ncbi:pre-mRNA-processing factor 39 isoform X2 [Aphidius gifuensis]|nr:pre-mRNA-processing factor 39 isoform X2 [Aphidius gifuensis]